VAQASASPTDGKIASRFAATLGPASACVAVAAIALFYLPNLHSVFFEPKRALLYLAGAVGLGAQLLIWADPPPLRVRLSPSMVGAVLALLATTVLAAVVAKLRGAPGAPYAGLEILRFLAIAAVALSAARAAAVPLWRRRLLASIHVAGGLVSLIGFLQHLQLLPVPIPTISVPGSTFGNRNVAAEAVAMSIPFGLAWLALAWPRGAAARDNDSSRTEARLDPPGPILLVLALELVYLGATRTRGAWLGATLGIVAFYALARRALPGAALGVVLALVVAALAAAVIPGRLTSRDVGDAKRFEAGEHVVSEALDPRSPVLRERLGLWRRTLAMYRAQPLFGVGPGNFQIYFPAYAEPGAHADGVMTAKIVPRRAHEDLLERLAETGPLGLAALLAVYAVGLGIALRRSRLAAADPAHASEPGDEATIAAAAAGCLAALFACGLSGFPLAMPATALLFAIALGFLACEGTMPARAASASGVPRPPRAVAILVSLAIVAATAIGSVRGLTRSYWLARERAALRPGALDLNAALRALRAAERASPGTFEVALETAYVLERLHRFGDSLAATDRALAIEPYAIPTWLVRAEAALDSGDARAALDNADRALQLFVDYPDALVVRALAETRLGNADAARAAYDHLWSLAMAGDLHAKTLLDRLRNEKGPP
jgi:O-antigen ligase